MMVSSPDINHVVLIGFAELLDTAAFKVKFNSLEGPLKRFWEWSKTETVPTAKEIWKEWILWRRRESLRKKNLSFWRVKIWHFASLELGKFAMYQEPPR